MKKAVFLQDHTVVYENHISDDISEYQQTNYRLRSIIKEYSPPRRACEVDIPLCWSGILLKYVKKIVSVDDDIVFNMVRSEHAGLKIKASVATPKFQEVKFMVKAATREIDEFVQKRLKMQFVQQKEDS